MLASDTAGALVVVVELGDAVSVEPDLAESVEGLDVVVVVVDVVVVDRGESMDM